MLRTRFPDDPMLTLLTGVVYPLAMTGLAHLVFPAQAHGSLVENGRVTGSSSSGASSTIRILLVPAFGDGALPLQRGVVFGLQLRSFQPRSQKAMEERRKALRAPIRGTRLPIPIDLLTASAQRSRPAYQPGGRRVPGGAGGAPAGLDARAVRRLIAAHTERRQLGFLGEPVVNVSELNRALEAKAGRQPFRPSRRPRNWREVVSAEKVSVAGGNLVVWKPARARGSLDKRSA